MPGKLAIAAAAVIDRLLRHFSTVIIRGESYWLKARSEPSSLARQLSQPPERRNEVKPAITGATLGAKAVRDDALMRSGARSTIDGAVRAPGRA